MLLVLTNANDSHADVVLAQLARLAVPHARFNTETFPSLSEASLSVSSRVASARLSGKDLQVVYDNVTAVWLRRPMGSAAIEVLPTDEATAACRHMLGAVWQHLAGRTWINPIPAERSARCKPDQLRQAIGVGLETPRTLITSDANAVLQFMDELQSDHLVYKTLTSHRVEQSGSQPRAIYARRVSRDEIRNGRRQIGLAPCLFQEVLYRSAELRVTVIGHDLFVDEITGPDRGGNAIDWRPDLHNRQHRPSRLDPDIADKVFALVGRLGLVFACVDLIRTRDGKCVFLELNPSGQWYWVEAMTGLPLLASFTRLLRSATRSEWRNDTLP